MIALEGVRKVYSGGSGASIIAVDDVSLTIEEGETVCLIGTSGSGKTTTMKMINRMVEPSAGRVLVGGEDVLGLDPIRLRRRLGYVIQKGGLFPHMTVARNIGLLPELEGWEADRIATRVDALLAMVNLEVSLRDRYPRALSGGQRQRVGVARALALDPEILLMDEPFGALDPITRAQLHLEFQQLQRTVGKTVVLVTHDMAEAFMLGDRVALMDEGRLIQIGDEADFRQRPASDFVAAFVGAQLSGRA